MYIYMYDAGQFFLRRASSISLRLGADNGRGQCRGSFLPTELHRVYCLAMFTMVATHDDSDLDFSCTVEHSNERVCFEIRIQS